MEKVCGEERYLNTHYKLKGNNLYLTKIVLFLSQAFNLYTLIVFHFITI